MNVSKIAGFRCSFAFVNGVLKTINPGRPRRGPLGVVDSAVTCQPPRSLCTRVVRSGVAPTLKLVGCHGNDERSRINPCNSTARLDDIEVFVEANACDACDGVG